MSRCRGLVELTTLANQRRLPLAGFFRHWQYTAAYPPDAGQLGWYARRQDGSTVFLGHDLDAALKAMRTLPEVVVMTEDDGPAISESAPQSAPPKQPRDSQGKFRKRPARPRGLGAGAFEEEGENP